ncbi:hypothetical protein [Veillonella seminalis]|uniref:hypothetical protein n=1 Tax=Veillonella seminalis TaxID=1502943 RepID=UPI0020620040|nr:MAG TPA: hypothetical protein [Caudoviricetes sp.]
MSKKIRFKFYLPQEFQGQAIEADVENDARVHLDHLEKMALYDFSEAFIEVERQIVESDE